MKLSDFNITGKPIPPDVADKIVEYHLLPLMQIDKENEDLGIFVSANSGYRPRWYELERGREGNSQHCFYGKGAVDLSCKDFKDNKWHLLGLLVDCTEYSRFAVYDTFIHVDYALLTERWVYDSKWIKQYQL